MYTISFGSIDDLPPAWRSIYTTLEQIYRLHGDHSDSEARDKARRAVQRMIEEKENDERELLQRD